VKSKPKSFHSRKYRKVPKKKMVNENEYENGNQGKTREAAATMKE